MKFEKQQLTFFAWLYAAGAAAATFGATTGHPWHTYTALLSALVALVLFREVKKLKKQMSRHHGN